MMRLRLAVAAMALCLLVSTATAACISRSEFVSLLAARLPQAEVTLLEGDRARMFLASLNRLPPATALSADEIVIIHQGPAAPALRIVLFENGCITRIGILPRALLRKLMNELARSGA
jgi:hypothetical protein